MPEIRIEPLGVVLHVREGETLLAAAWREGYRWPSTCEGQGRCHLCFVDVIEGSESLDEPSAWELEGLAALALAYPDRGSGLRLACQLRPHGAVVISKRGVRPPGT